MSNPNLARIAGGTPDGGQFAHSDQAEAALDLPHDGPTAEDRAQLAALYEDARIASEATARFELGCAKMLAQGVLRQWPDARYLELTESDQGTGSHFAGAVLTGIDPPDKLADLADEELANGANPEELAMNLSTGGAWMEHTTTHPLSRQTGTVYLDLRAAAGIEESAIELAIRRATNGPELQNQAEEQIGGVVREMIPDADAWSAGTRETTEDSYEFADNEIVVTKTDGTQEYLDLQWADQSAPAEARRTQVQEALTVLSDLAGGSLTGYDAYTVVL